MERVTKILPKCYLRGVDILIFITVGTSSYQFNRILEIVDELCNEGIIEGNDIFAQTGVCEYKPMN